MAQQHRSHALLWMEEHGGEGATTCNIIGFIRRVLRMEGSTVHDTVAMQLCDEESCMLALLGAVRAWLASGAGAAQGARWVIYRAALHEYSR